MQFNSIEFLLYFLPVFLLAYYNFPRSWRSRILTAASLVFYGLNCGENYWMLGLLVLLTIWTYLMGRLIGKPGRGWLLPACLTVMVGVLAFFKLYRSGSMLPVGLSFYLFQMAAYLTDVSQRNIQCESNLLHYGAKMMMFPRLLSGPIMESKEVARQEAEWDHPESKLHRGLQEFILGLSMKVLLADPLGGLWSQAAVIGYESISSAFAWLALITFALRLYLDFWAYSLMAMGLGRLIGFELPKNFDNPYASGSVSEFYRRWHMTLGLWFRKYIYIPLGGNRKGTVRTILNLCVVWLLTGLWHGIGANYLLWAGILCFLIVNERLWLGKVLDRIGFLRHVYTVFVILLSWVPFAIGGGSQMLIFVGRLFGQNGTALNGMDFWIWGKSYIGPLAAGILLATPFPGIIWKKVRKKAVADVFLFVLFWIVIYCIATSQQSPFLYFQY